MSATVHLQLNGQPVSGPVEGRTHLADFLRETLLQTGTHLGCEQGVCGACTVFVDGRPTRACITLAASCDGAQVTTVEGFDDDPLMADLRAAFSRHHGLQCGYCTPGMLATAYDIVRRCPDADRERIRRELSGNLCRCTGYAGIVDAIAAVLLANPPSAALQPSRRSQAAPNVTPTAQSRVTSAVATASSDLELPSADDFDGAVALRQNLRMNLAAADAWRLLRDPQAVAECIPGARLDGPPQGDLIAGACRVAVGPIHANFQGQARFTADDDSRSGRLLGQGRDRLSRTLLAGMLDFTLLEDGAAACRLELDMRYRLSGPLSQFGRPELVREIAATLLATVGATLEARVMNPEAKPSAANAVGGVGLLFSVLMTFIKRGLRLR